MAYAGDPLADFSTMAFLDRFSYKNPKQLRAGGADGEAGGPEQDVNRGAGALKRVGWGTTCVVLAGVVWPC